MTSMTVDEQNAEPLAEEEPTKILLIEDSKGDALLIKKSLESAMGKSHIASHVSTLEDAIQALEKEHYDVALLDRTLPDAEGFSGLYALQNMSPKLPVIFLTGYEDEEVACNAINQGAQDYLFKNKIDGEEMRRSIRYAVLRKNFENKLIMRANQDMLTGLANRMVYENRLTQALAKLQRQGGIIAVLFMDLDKFKEINDTLGHAAGDALLKEIGRRLKRSLRPYDTIARFGGDEFAILLEDIPAVDRTEAVAKKLIDLIKAPCNIAGETVEVGVSIGIAACLAGRVCSVEELLHEADEAMYKAKKQPGNAYEYHDISIFETVEKADSD